MRIPARAITVVITPKIIVALEPSVALLVIAFDDLTVYCCILLFDFLKVK